MSEELQHASNQIETELSKKLFHLKTLYDVSRELIGMDSMEAIMHSFLLMSTGNFGILEGFMQLSDRRDGVADKFESVGIQDGKRSLIEQMSGRMLAKETYHGEGIKRITGRDKGLLPEFIDQTLTFQVSNTCTGMLGLGPKIIGDPFSETDLDLLETLVNNLVAALKNALSTEALKEAYHEVSSLNRAKDKVINHLSHELKTPIALLGSSLTLLTRTLAQVPDRKWERIIERAQRSLKRLADLQQEAGDIMQTKAYESRRWICDLLDQCSDELESLVAQQVGEESVAACVRERIDAIFNVQPNIPEEIALGGFARAATEAIRPDFSHRNLDLKFEMAVSPMISVPPAVLTKVIEGLVKNAVENTPDEGKIRVAVTASGNGAAFEVRDFGVGILHDHQARIFEGFFPTQQTNAYASKQPFDFNAGGKGADLLRMKIFSERFGFCLDFTSERCRHLPSSADVCPGAVHQCDGCSSPEDCFDSGGSIFKATFPSISISS
jgi:signal transduction histidine kinase